mmetsp:Transcript_23149/g.61862  ORF Transcript_23149/g.61862 Transcript_23149/m.61862 type:complete len:300 (+) Transcript_23149:87-986(+)
MGDEAAGQEFGSILNITGSVLINLGNNLMSSGQQGGGESTPVTKRRGSSDDYEGVEMDETGDSKASSTNGKGGVPRRDSSEHVELTLSPRLGDDYVDGDEWETGPDELGEFHHRDGAGNVLDRQNSSDVDGLMTGVPNSTAAGTSPSKAIKIVLKNGVKAVKNGQCPAPPPPSWSNASALWRRLKLCIAAVLAWLLPLLQVVHTVAWRMIETVRPAWCNRWFLGCVFFGIGTGEKDESALLRSSHRSPALEHHNHPHQCSCSCRTRSPRNRCWHPSAQCSSCQTLGLRAASTAPPSPSA